MGRPLRIEFSGACYHVINRGNYRNWILRDGGAPVFERTLDEAARRFGWLIHAYVVMSSHFHLALQLTEPNLSEGMKWLQGTWIRRTNGFRGLTGRPFQGRYKSILIEPGEALGRVCHYIHLNPVRAGIVAAGKAGEYPWSSLPKMPLAVRPPWLCVTTCLGDAGGLVDSPAGWNSYLNYLEFLGTDEMSRRELVAAKMSRGWCIGSEGFQQEMALLALEQKLDLARQRFTGLPAAELKQEKERSWEMRLQQLARSAGISLEALSAKCSHPKKVILAAAMKSSTSASNAWLTQRLQMGRPASVSQFVSRWLREPKNNAALRELLSNVEGVLPKSDLM